MEKKSELPKEALEGMEELKKTEAESKEFQEQEETMTDEERQTLFNNALELQRRMGYNRKGYRQIGRRKQHLIRTFDKELAKLHKRGINTKYLVKNYLKISDVKKVTTKEWTGLISKLKQFAKESA